MPQPRLRPEVMREAYDAVGQHGAVIAAARALKLPPATLQWRYEAALTTLGLPDHRWTQNALNRMARPYDPKDHPRCAMTLRAERETCTVLVFSDAHWTTLAQPRSLAHEAMLAALPDIAPDVIVANGDLLDFTAPSRHPPLGWSKPPTVTEELAAGKRHLADIEALAPNAERYWVRGNHDDRFDRFLAANAAAFEGVEGFAFADHFSAWRMCWRLDLNDAVFLHANHNGLHGAWNDTLKAGVTTIAGHNHILEVKPLTDMRGRRWGIKTGMLGDPAWPCFSYALANPKMWNPGFVVLTWRDGTLLPPEVCEVANGVAWFRGRALAGKPRVRVKAGRP